MRTIKKAAKVLLDEEMQRQVKYSNDLVTFDVAQMTALAQNLITFCFWKFTENPKTSYIFTYDEIRKVLMLTRQGDRVLDDAIFPNVHSVLNRMSRFVGRDENGDRYSMSLIPYFKEIKEKRILKIELNSHFWEVYGQFLREKYVCYDLQDFLKIKTKWGKSLYRLVCRYFLGFCTLSNEDVRLWMGMSPEMANRDVVRIVKRAAEELCNCGVVTGCKVIPNYVNKKLNSISFEYSFPNSKRVSDDANKGDCLLSEPPKVKKQRQETQTSVSDREIFVNRFTNKITPWVKNDEIDRIDKLIDKYGLADCLKAIEIADGKGKSLPYVARVLENMVRQNRDKPRVCMDGPYADRDIPDYHIPF